MAMSTAVCTRAVCTRIHSCYRGVFHIGARVLSMLRHPLACSDGATRQGVLYCSPQGSMGVVVPTWNKAACAALERVQLVLALRLPHAAGLNPAAFRCGVSINLHARF